MAKMRDYLVSFCPAEKTEHGFATQISLMTTGTKHPVSADSFAALEAEVRRLAREYGRSCSPFVCLKNRGERNPPGFDKWAYSREMQFIEYIPEPAAAAA